MRVKQLSTSTSSQNAIRSYMQGIANLATNLGHLRNEASSARQKVKSLLCSQSPGNLQTSATLVTGQSKHILISPNYRRVSVATK